MVMVLAVSNTPFVEVTTMVCVDPLISVARVPKAFVTAWVTEAPTSCEPNSVVATSHLSAVFPSSTFNIGVPVTVTGAS